MAFQIQYKGNFGGASSGGQWLPAVTGTLNQTSECDAVASTFETREVAVAFLEDEILPQAGDGTSAEFRIEEVDAADDAWQSAQEPAEL